MAKNRSEKWEPGYYPGVEQIDRMRKAGGISQQPMTSTWQAPAWGMDAAFTFRYKGHEESFRAASIDEAREKAIKAWKLSPDKAKFLKIVE